MTPLNKTSPCSVVLLSLSIVMLTGCAANRPPLETTGEFSHDGLVPLQDTSMSRVWVRRGYNVGGYTKVMFGRLEIQYRPVRPGSGSVSWNPADKLPIGPQQRKELEALITSEFDIAMERMTLEQVADAGPDVLVVRGYILDVVSMVPTDPDSGAKYWLDAVGQATFVVELIDSQSNSVLLRALDTRSFELPGTRNPDLVSDSAEARALMSRWANILVDALNELTAIDNLSRD